MVDRHNYVNPFVPNAPFLCPLKTSENLTVFCFQGVEKGCAGNEWVNMILNQVHCQRFSRSQTPNTNSKPDLNLSLNHNILVNQSFSVLRNYSEHYYLPEISSPISGECFDFIIPTQPAITCSKLTVESLEQGVKYVQI